MKGCPLIVQSDCGTENGNIAATQRYFREDTTDEYAGEKAHRYGESKRNQRIESWWSCFRKTRSSWWINLVKDLMDNDMNLNMEMLSIRSVRGSVLAILTT